MPRACDFDRTMTNNHKTAKLKPTYCQTLVSRPQETIIVLISDLYVGGNAAQMLSRAEL